MSPGPFPEPIDPQTAREIGAMHAEDQERLAAQRQPEPEYAALLPDEMDRLLRIGRELDQAEMARAQARIDGLREFEASVLREMSRSPEVAKAGLCRAEHPGRRRGDRIVECGLDKGHEPPEEHEEAETGIRWIAYPPGTRNPLSFSPRAEAMQWEGTDGSARRIGAWLGTTLGVHVTNWIEKGQGIGQQLGGAPVAAFRFTRPSDRAYAAEEHRIREGQWLVICFGRVWAVDEL